MSIPRATCHPGFNPQCYFDDVLRGASPSVTLSASPGDLVFFEIKRLGSPGLDDNVRQDFHAGEAAAGAARRGGPQGRPPGRRGCTAGTPAAHLPP
jgi:hypothetical protein